MKNKKGFIISTVVDFWAILTYIIIILLFYIIFKLTGAGISQQIISTDTHVETNTILLNLLKTPIDDNTDFTDLLLENIRIEDYDDFEFKIKEVLDPYYNNNYADCCWHMKILSNDGKILKKIKGNQCRTVLSTKKISKITIPSHDFKTYNITFIAYDELSLIRKNRDVYCKRKK